MNNVKICQNKRLVQYIVEHGSVTSAEAFRELGIMRTASRVHDLICMGVPIDGEMIEVVNRFGEKVRVKKYSINGEIPEWAQEWLEV